MGSWVLRYYPPAAQHKLGSPWIGPQQVIRQATGHTVGIQKEPEKHIMFVHVDDLKLCPGSQDISWVTGVPTAKSLCASTVAFRPGSHVSDMTPENYMQTVSKCQHQLEEWRATRSDELLN